MFLNYILLWNIYPDFVPDLGRAQKIEKKRLTWNRAGYKIPASMNAPYYLESIQEIIITTLYTSCIKGTVPVSLVLAAESGTAKSKLLQAIEGTCVHQTDSFTSTGLFELTKHDLENKLHWIVTPDMNPTLSRRPATVVSTVSNLLTLTMDGTCRVDDGRSEKIAKHNPMGFLSGITPDIYSKQAKKWLSLGLRRRIIPLFYEYTLSTIDKLKAVLREDKISGSAFPPMKFNRNGEHKPVIGENMAYQIESKGTQLSIHLGLQKIRDDQGKLKWYVRSIVPISPITTLRTLARAHALKDNRAEVNEADINFLSTFLDFTNPSCPKQI